MKEEPEFKTYIEREGKVIEVSTLEESFNTAMENRISYHRWKLDGCVSVKDYSGAVYHENAIFIFQDSINIFNGLVREKAKENSNPTSPQP